MSDDLFPMSRVRLIGLVTVLTFGLTTLFGAAGLSGLSGMIFTFGFFLVIPLVLILGSKFPGVEAPSEDDDGSVGVTDDPSEAMARLRERYADGEIDDVEFERRMERLLEIEALEREVEDRERAVELE